MGKKVGYKIRPLGEEVEWEVENVIFSDTHVKEHGNSQHNQPHHEGTSQLVIFSLHKPPFDPHTNKPHSMDNYTYNHFPKLDLNNFHGSNPLGLVTQMEHYFYLHAITNDMVKLQLGVLYLDPKIWQWWEWHKNSYG